MSATILWEPTDHGQTIPVNAPSRFQEALEAASLWNTPIRIENLPAIAGICTACGETKALTVLHDALGTHEEIRLWAEW